MLLISGLSGASKSTVLHTLEDAGFFCTDNLPLEMLRDWSLQLQLIPGTWLPEIIPPMQVRLQLQEQLVDLSWHW